jgi:hypothetical protein
MRALPKPDLSDADLAVAAEIEKNGSEVRFCRPWNYRGGRLIDDITREEDEARVAAGLRKIELWVPDPESFGSAAEDRVRQVAAEECAAVAPLRKSSI